MENLNLFVDNQTANQIISNANNCIHFTIGNGYSVVEYFVPSKMKNDIDVSYISNILTPDGEYVLDNWTTANICTKNIDEQCGWIKLSINSPHWSLYYVNYLNVDGEFLLDNWLTIPSNRNCLPFTKAGFAQIVYKGKRAKLFPDGTIEMWSGNTKSEINMCTNNELKTIKKRFGNIGCNFKLDKGVISFIIDRDDYISEGGNPLSKFFCVRDAHSWNNGISTNWTISDNCRVIISRPPRFNGKLCLSIKKSAAWKNLDIPTQFNDITEVGNAIIARLEPAFDNKKYNVRGNWISKR